MEGARFGRLRNRGTDKAALAKSPPRPDHSLGHEIAGVPAEFAEHVVSELGLQKEREQQFSELIHLTVIVRLAQVCAVIGESRQGTSEKPQWPSVSP